MRTSNIAKLTEEKVFKRRRSNKKHRTHVVEKQQQFLLKKDQSIISQLKPKVQEILRTYGFKDYFFIDNIVKFPVDFTLGGGYENTMVAIWQFASALINNIGGDVTLDFSSCKTAETATFFMLRVIRYEIEEYIGRNIAGVELLRTNIEIQIKPSQKNDVNRLMYLSTILSKEFYEECKIKFRAPEDNLLEPIDRTGFLKGSRSQRNYVENKKSIHTTTIVKYVNSCLGNHDYELNASGQNYLEGIISEILNNAEDHGILNNWFVTANFSKETSRSQNQEDVVGEMNVVILNFGKSIYDGLIQTKEKNYEMYHQLVTTKQNLDVNYPNHSFTEDNLFTLYALQDGISRLKYEDESRGTGTMKFLNSFLMLGDYENKGKGFKPNLSIYSGRTQVICDNDYKPFENNNVYSLTLNSEKSLKHPPKRSHLKNLNNIFPGTLLAVKVYLSKSHLDNKLNNKGHDN